MQAIDAVIHVERSGSSMISIARIVCLLSRLVLVRVSLQICAINLSTVVQYLYDVV